jgi:hypothetical protein
MNLAGCTLESTQSPIASGKRWFRFLRAYFWNSLLNIDSELDSAFLGGATASIHGWLDESKPTIDILDDPCNSTIREELDAIAQVLVAEGELRD